MRRVDGVDGRGSSPVPPARRREHGHSAASSSAVKHCSANDASAATSCRRSCAKSDPGASLEGITGSARCAFLHPRPRRHPPGSVKNLQMGTFATS